MPTMRKRTLTLWVAGAALLGAAPFGVTQVQNLAAASGSTPQNCGNCQGNSGSGGGNGGSAGSGSPGKALTASVLSTTPVAPGRNGTVTIRVSNPNNQDVQVTKLSGTVLNVTTGDRPGLRACDASWIILDPVLGGPLIRKNGSADVAMPVRFDNKPTVNQDNCKGVTYTFAFTVEGRQA